MPIRDTAAMNHSLDDDYGTTRGPNAADSHLLTLWDGTPMIPVIDGGGSEIVGNGYARVEIFPADWSSAVDGMKTLVAPVQFPATTGEWPEGAEYWGLIDAADGVTMWDCGPLAEPLEVTGAGDGPIVSVSVYYDDAVRTDPTPAPDPDPDPPPPPPPPSTMLVGISQALFSAFVTKLAGTRTVPIRRSYGTSASSSVTLANQDGAAGRTAWVSFATWPGDAAINAFVGQFTSPVMLTYAHEVDLLTKEVTNATEFVRRQHVLYDAAVSLNPLVQVGPIFTAGPFRTGTVTGGTSIGSWVPSRMHFLGVDAYHYQREPGSPPDPKTGGTGTPRNMAYLIGEETAAGAPKAGGAVERAAAVGAPIAIGEYGFHPWLTDHTYRPTWLQDTHDYLESVGCIAEMYFHSPRGVSGPWMVDQFHVYTTSENDAARLTGADDVDSFNKFKSFLPLP